MYVAGAYITISEGAGAMTGLSPDVQLPWDMQFGVANSPWEVRQKDPGTCPPRRGSHQGVVHGRGADAWEQSEIDRIHPGGVARSGGRGRTISACALPRTPTPPRASRTRSARASPRSSTRRSSTTRASRSPSSTARTSTWISTTRSASKSAPDTPADFLKHDQDLGEIQRRNFTKAVRAGVKMTFGTDAGVCPHGINARQFAFMVKYGMTPMQAIQSATVNAADLIGHSELFGTHQRRKVGGHRRGEGRSARRHPRPRACRLRHEGRGDLQT